LTLVLWLIGIATLLTFVGGIGFVAARIAEAMTVSVVFGYVLYVAAAITMAALMVAVIVGFYHLYLYLFTDKRPLSLFATTNKSDD
jgi:FlaG/FlaF family flagellin (archaellin)